MMCVQVRRMPRMEHPEELPSGWFASPVLLEALSSSCQWAILRRCCCSSARGSMSSRHNI